MINIKDIHKLKKWEIAIKICRQMKIMNHDLTLKKLKRIMKQSLNTSII